MEEKVIRPFYHNHPLILKKNVSKEEGVDCYACGNPVANMEMVYVCIENDCRSNIILHKKCGELPSEIRHPKHRDHPLLLFNFHRLKNKWCDLCFNNLDNVLGYFCSSCYYYVDIACEKIDIEMIVEGRKELQHPSHPDHPLTLMRKPALAFTCDACGVRDVDMAYICSTCEFWVHRCCAELPLHRGCRRHHHHHLSMAFSFSKEERLKYIYTCTVCDELFDRSCWVYFCGDCKYFVHINCLDQSTTTPKSIDVKEDENDGVMIQFPLDIKDMANILITPFVMREKGLDSIPTPTSNIFLSNYHDHPLSLVLEETNSEDEEEELIKICDVCVTPISSSSPYYQCPTSACNYFIHAICSMLPNNLDYSSSPDLIQLYKDCPKIPNKIHNFTLCKVEDKLGISWWRCDLCKIKTNGMGYVCEECEMCASLPTTLRCSSHHKPLILNGPVERKEKEKGKGKGKDKGKMMKNCCHACYDLFPENGPATYYCIDGDCDFRLEIDCLLNPMSVKDSEWDSKHPLLLTFDAYLDHPSDFFCDSCEEQMHPQIQMYHCRECDVSLHPRCLPTAAGYLRNFKFGRRYELKGIHKNHSLTYTYITLKKRCDVCHNMVYTYAGFECADCYFVVCYDCGCKELEKAWIC